MPMWRLDDGMPDINGMLSYFNTLNLMFFFPEDPLHLVAVLRIIACTKLE